MESLSILFILISTLFLIGCLLTPIAARLGAPFLLLFLCIGMLMGEDGFGGVYFSDFSLAYEIGSVALALILFSGGLDTDMATLRKAAAPAFVLSIGGVILTAVISGALIHFIFGLALDKSLLLGAVIGSTDAAATFLLLRQRNIRLKDGLGETLISVLPELFKQLGLGAVAGVIGGVIAASLINKIPMPVSLFAPFALATALLVFNATAIFDGSGFLAVYVCGVVLRHRVTHQTERVSQFHDGLSWISQIVLFLMLGLLVTPSNLMEILPIGLGVAGILIFIARPIATFLCLTPFGMGIRQQTFIGWVGLRGAVPIFLAIIPVISPGPIGEGFFDIVFVVVIASLFLQGWTISLMANWLDLTEKEPTATESKD